MKLVKLSSLVFFVVWYASVSSQARAAAVTDVGKCTRDEDCPDKEFCFRYGACAKCRNCTKMGRLLPRDSNCAHTKDECGPCMPGYRDIGTVCLPTEETPRIKSSDKPLTENNQNNHTSQQPSSTITISSSAFWLTVVLVILMVPCLVGLIYYGRNWWKAESFAANGGENASQGLLLATLRRQSSENLVVKLPEGIKTDEFGASAPPEYQPQSPYNNMFAGPGPLSATGNGTRQVPDTPSTCKDNSVRIAESRKQKALPFASGNGSGQWTVVCPMENYGNQMAGQNLEFLDNAPPSPEQPQPDDVQMAIAGIIEHGADNQNVDRGEAGAGGIPNVEHPEPQVLEQIIHFSLFARASLSISTNTTPEREEINIRVNEAPGWMENTQMEVMNPRTDSTTSLDSGISSNCEPVPVPNLENIPIAPDSDVVMEEDT